MERHSSKLFGTHMASPVGWIVAGGEDSYYHRLGGSRWNTSSLVSVCGEPTLLLTLDLNDPKLQALGITSIKELPLCYSVNCDALLRKQVFRIRRSARSVDLIDIDANPPEPVEILFPERLPEVKIKLSPMEPEDYPSNENLYEEACERFLGGNSFIRVLGPPLWLQWPEEVFCHCGLLMNYVCSVGYERPNRCDILIPKLPIFLGEAALYFFICRVCLQITVISQST